MFQVIQPVPQEQLPQRFVEQIVDVLVSPTHEQNVEDAKVIPQESDSERVTSVLDFG